MTPTFFTTKGRVPLKAKSYKLKAHPAFTLIELIVYVAITAMVVVALVHVMIAILETREKTQYVGEMQYSLRFSMDRIVERMLNADGIESASGSVLALTVRDPHKDPTVFSLSKGRILLRQGSSAPHPLTSEKIRIETLRFENIANRIRVTIEGIDPNAGTGSSAHMMLQTSVFLRP